MARLDKTEKVSVTLPSRLVAEVRRLVPQGEVSAFFTEAVELYLARRRQLAALQKGFGAWKTKTHPDLATPEDSTAYIRSIREAGGEQTAQLGHSDGK